MTASTITLTTDFGLTDHYVGTMKGVLRTRAPHAQLVDISHSIPAFSIHAGAYAIAQAAPYFPAGTVHLVVIDPGVGSARRGLLACVDEQRFVAPDNGVLSLVAANARAKPKFFELTNRTLWATAPSATFHGRDIFAPVAAALAMGAEASQVGPEITDPALLADLAVSQNGNGRWQGIVLSIDHFGNVITNFPASEFAGLLRNFAFRAGGGEVTVLHSTFSDGLPGVCFAYSGSSGFIEFGMNRGRASDYLLLRAGDAVSLQIAG